MSEVTNALHEILEFAANTTTAMEVRVECYEGNVDSIKTAISPAEEKGVDKNELLKKLEIILDDLRMIEGWFVMVGYNDCPAHSRVIDVISDIRCLMHNLEKGA